MHDTVTIAQAGHPAPLLLRGGEVERLDETGFPIGMLPGLGYEQCVRRFEPGDRLVLYSDGVTECANPAREQFRIERLEHLMRDEHTSDLPAAVMQFERTLRSWRGGDEFQDDVTFLALERRAA